MTSLLRINPLMHSGHYNARLPPPKKINLLKKDYEKKNFLGVYDSVDDGSLSMVTSWKCTENGIEFKYYSVKRKENHCHGNYLSMNIKLMNKCILNAIIN